MLNHSPSFRMWRIFALGSLLFLASCIKAPPLPPPPEVPDSASSGVLHIGMESNLTSLEPILAEWVNQTGQTDDESQEIQENQMALFVTGSYNVLQRQVAAGELDGLFIYQKPTNPALWTMPVALDSIAIVAHPDLPLTSLSRSNLQQIFAGDVENWAFVTGQNRPISVFVTHAESAIQGLFNERVMENRPFEISAIVPLGHEAMLQHVAETEGGIGFLPTSSIGPDAAVQIVPVDNFFPQFNTVRSQQYPLTIPIYMVMLEEPQGEMRRLAAWLQSAEGQQKLATAFVQIGN